MRANTSQNTKDRLNQERGFDQPSVNKVRSGIKMANVVALNLKACLVVAARLQYVSDVFKGIFKHAVVTVGKVRYLPFVIEGFEALEHVVQAKVHGAHVQGGNFWFEMVSRAQAISNGHGWCAARGEVDHHIAFFFDFFQKWHKQFWILRRTAVYRIACMQMNNGCTSFGRSQCGFSNLVCSHWQMWRHAWRVNSAGDGTGNDDFARHKKS